MNVVRPFARILSVEMSDKFGSPVALKFDDYGRDMVSARLARRGHHPAPPFGVSWDGNPKEIETVAYRDPRRDQRVVRRATFAERVAGALQWDTIRIILSLVILAATGAGDFGPLDFDPLDFG